ncbi:taste receptor type 2 member 124-like [Peromyscus californicus insignis]|uniref:taste receptor type 2 member 124-like n=1 Tax=Peromyscus californicus insignis TaxID=564181 RepID=UPI0022A73524|nr:taste receptor type 2 member 124-like [Peromyscus californicus insignis]
MGPVLHSISTTAVVAEFILGNLSNGLIVLNNCIDWINKKALSPVDQIFVILAISRVTLLWETVIIWIKTQSISFITREELKILVFCWILSSHFCLWLSTALSIFYLFRIANFSWQIFLYLKWRPKQLIVGVLLGSLAFLLANLMQIGITLEERLNQYGGNTTMNFMETDFTLLSELALFNMTMFSVTPFSLALISFLLLIFSLWKHLQKMQLNSRGHGDPNTKAHRNAMKIIVSFLLLYATYFVSLLIAWITEKHHIELVHIICMITGLMYPSTHSLILILGNSKLKQTSLLILRHLGCRLKGQNIPTT